MPKLRNTPDPSQIGKLISYYIKEERRSTYGEIAGRMGVSYQTMRRWLKEEPQKMSLEELRKFGTILHIPQNELLESITAAIKYE